MVDILTEVRRRLDVTSVQVSDDILTHFIDTAAEAVNGYVPVPNRVASGYTEGIIQLAVKMYDTSARGTVSVDAAGEFIAPAPSATPGLIRSIWGIIGPLTAGQFA